MEFLLILCGASLALGLFFIAADLFKLPRLATQKALLSAGRQEKKQARTTDVLLMGWAVKLAPHIHDIILRILGMIHTKTVMML